MEPTPDGHRAPIAELFRYNARTVNTQTPVNLQPNSTSSSSGNNYKIIIIYVADVTGDRTMGTDLIMITLINL